jgi:hypothetical protein
VKLEKRNDQSSFIEQFWVQLKEWLPFWRNLMLENGHFGSLLGSAL